MDNMVKARDLIYRDEAEKAIDGMIPAQGNIAQDIMKAMCGAAIATIPKAVDAVEVVRCKECWKRGLDNCPMEFYFDCHPAEDDCYCKFGEYGTAEEINEKDKD